MINNFTIAELRKRLRLLKKRGFVSSLRSHNTGVGHTLEQFLGLSENNISIPDLGKLELKSQRRESASLITLFTKKPDDALNSRLLEKFGYPREKDGLRVLHQTVIAQRKNKQGFKLQDSAEKLKILKNREYVFSYNKKKLGSLFDNKFGKGIILVLAVSHKNSKGKESFHYQEAYILKGGNFNRFLRKLFYDIRIGRYPDGRPHDHGSAFRAKKTDLPSIFRIYRKLV
ncbi:MAG: MvaI/BcnI family restriction endonuclease [Patescibacteria group bacterium]